MFQKGNIYELLGVAEDADTDAIKAAYRRLAKKYHPDLSKDQRTVRRFVLITRAHKTLLNPDARRRYDLALMRQRARSRAARTYPFRFSRYEGDNGRSRLASWLMAAGCLLIVAAAVHYCIAVCPRLVVAFGLGRNCSEAAEAVSAVAHGSGSTGRNAAAMSCLAPPVQEVTPAGPSLVPGMEQTAAMASCGPMSFNADHRGDVFCFSTAMRPAAQDLARFIKYRDCLPPDEQVRAVAAKLAEVNRCGEIMVRSYKTDGDAVVELVLDDNPGLVSVQPLAGMKLKVLSLRRCTSLASLAGIEGLPLRAIFLQHCYSLAGIAQLKGMALRELFLTECSGLVGDLSALAGMKLTHLDLLECRRLTSLAGIEGSPLIWVRLEGCASLTDLSPLAGKPLDQMSLRGCEKLAGGLSVLRKMKLTSLDLAGCRSLVSLSGIEGMALKRLNLEDCRSLTSLAPLARMPLVWLNLADCKGLAGLKGLEKLPLEWVSIRGCAQLTPADKRVLQRNPMVQTIDQ